MNIKLIVIAMLIGFCLSSCGDTEPMSYSCDKNVDAWVKSNLSEIKSMTRSSWLETDESVSIPIYRAFNGEQRVNFWIEKIQEVKLLDWSDPEIEHLCMVEDFIMSHKDFFYEEKLSDDQLDAIELFSYKWSETARKEFGWSEQVIYSIIGCGNRVLDTNGTIQPLRKNIANGVLLSASESTKCNCNVGSLITCSLYVSCLESTCSGTSTGCGFFLMFECNGNCEEPF